jgi:hypothetical protein
MRAFLGQGGLSRSATHCCRCPRAPSANGHSCLLAPLRSKQRQRLARPHDTQPDTAHVHQPLRAPVWSAILLPHEHTYKEGGLLSKRPLLAAFFLPGKSRRHGPLFRPPSLTGASAPHHLLSLMRRSYTTAAPRWSSLTHRNRTSTVGKPRCRLPLFSPPRADATPSHRLPFPLCRLWSTAVRRSCSRTHRSTAASELRRRRDSLLMSSCVNLVPSSSLCCGLPLMQPLSCRTELDTSMTPPSTTATEPLHSHR